MATTTQQFRVLATATLAVALTLLPAVSTQAGPLPDGIDTRLEAALNSSDTTAIAALLSDSEEQPADLIGLRLTRLTDGYGPLTWTVKQGDAMEDGRTRLELSVQGTRDVAGTMYRMEASQTVAVSSHNGRITGQDVLAEESFIFSGEERLPVTLMIPDAVLTGERYNVDVVIDEPLGDTIVAGGLLEVRPLFADTLRSPAIKLGVLSAGGLFKRVQAPYAPGGQTWTVMLVHPDGILITSKRVQVSSR